MPASEKPDRLVLLEIPESNKNVSRLSRPVFELVERFERNPRIKNADEDIREQRFLVEHEKMFLIYHKKDNYITASSRNFEKVEVQVIL